MTFPSFGVQRVVRERGRLVDDGRGNTKVNWASPERVEYVGSIQPGASVEDLANRDGTTVKWTAYLPGTADVEQSTDRMVYRGKIYAVNGDPSAWPSPTGGLDNVVVLMSRWEG